MPKSSIHSLRRMSNSEATVKLKSVKYQTITQIFVSAAVDTLEPIRSADLKFQSDPGNHWAFVSGGPSTTSVLFQRLNQVMGLFQIFQTPMVNHSNHVFNIRQHTPVGTTNKSNSTMSGMRVDKICLGHSF